MRTRSRIALAAAGITALAAIVAGTAIIPGAVAGTMADADIVPTSYTTMAKVPVGDGSTTSFSTTTPDRGVGKWSSATEQFGCPAGWYIRMGGRNDWTPTIVYPAVRDYSSSGWMSLTTGPELQTPIAGTTVYQGGAVGYHNSGPTTHHFHVTYWCDKLDAATARTTASAVGSVGDFSNAAVKNVGTGTYLQWGAQGQSPTLGTSADVFSQAGDDNGDTGTYDYAPLVGFWALNNGSMVGNSLQLNGTSLYWAGGSSPEGANAPFIESYAPNFNGAMIVASSSVTGVPAPGQNGTGGLCLAASGSSVVLAPCDATDPNQSWVS